MILITQSNVVTSAAVRVITPPTTDTKNKCDDILLVLPHSLTRNGLLLLDMVDAKDIHKSETPSPS